MDYIQLIGTEDVSRAGSQIQAAAADMQRAADSVHGTHEQLQRILDDFLARLELILQQGHQPEQKT